MGQQFKVGTTYQARSICDYECIFSFEVIKRSAKRVTLRHEGQEFTRGVKVDDAGNEFTYPLGTYSMAPTIRAERPAEVAA